MGDRSFSNLLKCLFDLKPLRGDLAFSSTKNSLGQTNPPPLIEIFLQATNLNTCTHTYSFIQGCLDQPDKSGLARLYCASVLLFTWCVSSAALCSTVRPPVAPRASHTVRQLQVTQELLLFFYFTPIVTAHQHLFCEIFHL